MVTINNAKMVPFNTEMVPFNTEMVTFTNAEITSFTKMVPVLAKIASVFFCSRIARPLRSLPVVEKIS